MSEWTDSDSEKENCGDFEPSKKRQKLKLTSSAKGKQRFAVMASADEMESISKVFVPKNTAKNTRWAI